MAILHDSEIKEKKKWVYRFVIAILIIGIPLQVFPYVWMITNMFKGNLEIFQVPPTFIPNKFIWDNIPEAFKKYDLTKNILNTLILCAGTIVVQITISSLAAFSLSKLRKSRAILLFFVGTMMISSQALLIPTYLMMYDFPLIHVNLINNFLSVILSFSAWGYAVFLFKGFFDSIPDELMEAARMDGAKNLSIFSGIILPLSKPVFAVMILNTFMAVYNQFVFPLMLLPDTKKWTIMIRIYMSQSGNSQWNHVMVMLMVATVPILLIYILCQKYIVQGISMTGLKG